MSTTNRRADSKSEKDWSSREYLLLSQNHAVVAFWRSLQNFVRASAHLSRFETDRGEHGSDGGVGRDRGVRGTLLFRRSGKEKDDGSEGVDIVRLELGDLDVEVFVPARTPLLASMGRRVILSNDSKAVRNSAKKRESREY